eukprot:3994365-Heterocapsa_arctica.AAC.1
MLGIRLFGDRFKAAPCKLQLRSDSVAALATAGRLAAASPVLNFLGAEMAMDLELFGVLETETLHLPGALNVTAD